MEERVDEIEKYYKNIDTLETVLKPLFWITTALSFTPLLSSEIKQYINQNTVIILFVTATVSYFVISQYLRVFVIPTAEQMRRKQFLSDAFNTPLVYETTNLYYNNDYQPSIHRVGANALENALFSKAIAQKMLIKKRVISLTYIIFWLGMIIYESKNFDFIMSITQFLFSGSIVLDWLTLEVLHFRYTKVYNQLYSHFLHQIGDQRNDGEAAILDSFIEYESAKAVAGIKLSSKIFHEQNPTLTQEWERIKQTLKMNIESHSNE